MDKLYDLRIVLEVAALERLASGGEAAHETLDGLKTIWCVAPEARESDPVRMFGMAEHFHRQVVAATGNAEMVRVHNDVTERVRIVRRLDFLKPHRISATYDEHSTMLNLIERNRLTEATILLRAHITQSKLEVRKITLSMLAAARDEKLPFVS
jgi:DNA-binding GntR family transcriptional regulator